MRSLQRALLLVLACRSLATTLVPRGRPVTPINQLVSLEPVSQGTPDQLIKRAVQAGDHQTVQFLAEYVGLAADNNLLLRTASALGHVKTVQALLDSGWVSVAAADYEGFRRACKNGHLAVAKLLYSTNAIPPAGVKARGHYAIRKAAKYGHFEIVQWLLEVNADPAARDSYALRWAATNGHLSIVRLLCSRQGVKPHARLNEALHSAVSNGHAGVVQCLLEQPTVSLESCGQELLYLAVFNNHPAVLQVLLEDGRGDPAYWSNYLLSVASSGGHSACLQLLLEDERVLGTEAEFNPLYYAIYAGHLEACRLLIARLPGCDPSTMDARSLRLAAKHNHVDIVRLLLEDPRIRPSPKFNKVIRRAEKAGWIELLDLLLADPRTCEHHKVQTGGLARRRISKGVKSLGSPLSRPKIVVLPEEVNKYSFIPEPRFVELSDAERSHGGLGTYTSLSDTDHSAGHSQVSLEGQ